MPPRYTIRRAKPEDARADLVRLWRDNLPVTSAERKFAWTYLEPPRPPEDVFLLTTPGDKRDEIVGSAGVLLRDFRWDGRQVRAALLGDLSVDRAHRTLMPALTLVRGVREHVQATYDFAYGFPNDSALPVIRRSGYRELGKLTRYACVLRHGPYIRRMSPMPGFSMLGGALLDVGARARNAVGTLRTLTSHRLEWPLAVDGRFDRLWDEARGDYSIVGERSAAFLRWRFLRHPEDRCVIAALCARASGEVAAYAVVQEVEGVARIRDLFGRRDALGPLLEVLVPSLWGRGQKSASFRFFGAAWVEAVLLAHGFQAREATRTLVFHGSDALGGGTDQDRWHITDADEDV